MKFFEALNNYPFILTEGSVVERVRRNKESQFDENLANASLLYDKKGRQLLENIYRRYIEIGQKYNLPMISLTSTWRANKERLTKAGLINKNVNKDAFLFLDEIRKSYEEYANKIFIGGLIGCKGDAYNPAEALSRREAFEFHSWQLNKLAEAGVDFLKASTLPAASEAIGIAEAMSKTNLPYILSFVIRENGNLLDGKPLIDVINEIDSTVFPNPACYMVNCIHPTVFIKALEQNPELGRRVLGMQANTSCKTPEELDGSAELDTEEPEIFAEHIKELHQKYKIKILGGCCGTDDRHIEKIASRILAD